MKKISIRQCIEGSTCWPVSRLEEYGKQHGGGDEVPVWDILDDSRISVVDKMWVAITAEMLSEADMHELAILYAIHNLTDANAKGWEAIAMKQAWLEDRCEYTNLKDAENAAWEEGKVYPKSKGAACAAKSNPEIALRGAAVAAGGWFGPDVDSTEKMWQWNEMLKRLKR
jgi:hypothetical protein